MKYMMILLALLAATVVNAAENGTALKSDSIKAEPYGDAQSVGTIARGDKLEILGKQGAWLKVRNAKSSGWVRLLSVKRGTLGQSNDVEGVLGLASGRTGTGQVVSTTGVRGLSEEDLKAAKFNEEEMKKLESNGLSGAEAQRFASTGGLKARKLDYLPAPQGGAQ